MKAGRVDQVDLDGVPLGKGYGVGHGCAAGDVFFVVGGDGGAILNAAESWSHFGGVEEGGDEGGFSAVGVADESYVANVSSQILVHSEDLVLW